MLVKCVKRDFVNITIGKKYDAQVVFEVVHQGSISGSRNYFFLFDDRGMWRTYPTSSFEPVYQDEGSDSQFIGGPNGTANIEPGPDRTFTY
jgi:hypothetical protein